MTEFDHQTKDNISLENSTSAISAIDAKPHYPTLHLDITLYQEIMDDASIPEDQKHELIENLWAIAVACVDLGLGLHPLQQACGQFELYEEIPKILADDVVNCDHAIKDKFDAVNPARVVDSNSDNQNSKALQNNRTKKE